MWTSSGVPRLNTITAFFEKDSKVASSSNGKGGITIRTPTWKPLLTFSFGSAPCARSHRKRPMGVIMPSCWMKMVGYPNREVNSSG